MLRESAASWGIDLTDDASQVLKVRLLIFKVLETNQVIGATYNAEVRFAYSLSKPGQEPAMSGSAEGDATRYGRKFSNANINEVLSDALLEALAYVFSDPRLQRVWGK